MPASWQNQIPKPDWHHFPVGAHWYCQPYRMMVGWKSWCFGQTMLLGGWDLEELWRIWHSTWKWQLSVRSTILSEEDIWMQFGSSPKYSAQYAFSWFIQPSSHLSKALQSTRQMYLLYIRIHPRRSLSSDIFKNVHKCTLLTENCNFPMYTESTKSLLSETDQKPTTEFEYILSRKQQWKASVWWTKHVLLTFPLMLTDQLKVKWWYCYRILSLLARLTSGRHC
jgi:hypothetical protein